MNHHKFLLIFKLKHHLKFWCLGIYKTVYQAIMYFNTRYYFFKHFFVTNSDQLQLIRRVFMNHYKLHNHKFMTNFICWSLLVTNNI